MTVIQLIDRPRAAGVSRAFSVITVGFSAAGVVGLLLMTRWGIGTSPDAIAYIRSARQMLGLEPTAVSASVAQHSPLYPFLLAVAGLSGLDPLDAARWVNAVLLGANIFIVGYVVRRVTQNAMWLWAIAAIFMAGAVPVLTVHAVALSEPLFLLLTMTGLYLLARYVERPALPRLLVVSSAFALAFLARYAGAAGILAGGLIILWLAPLRLPARLASASVFGLCSGLPMAMWMLRNASVAGTATGRELAFHPVGRTHVWQAFETVSVWLALPAGLSFLARLSLMTAAGSALLAVLWATRRRTWPSFVKVLSVFAVTYGAFLGVSISFFDANTPLDSRILLPVLVGVLVLGLHTVDRAWPLLRPAPAPRVTIAVLLGALTMIHLLRGAAVVEIGFTKGWGLSNERWRHSQLLSEVRALPPRLLLYSNAPEILYLHTGRDARPLPRKRLLMKQQANRAFAPQLQRVREQLEERCGAVVFFRRLPDQPSLPTEVELVAALPLTERWSAREGAILAPFSCRP